MGYYEAKTEFQRVLNNQKTVEITKLKELMQALNISLEPSESQEINYLKGEIKKLQKDFKVLQSVRGK